MLSEMTETAWKVATTLAFVAVALFLGVSAWLKRNRPKKPGGGEPPSPKDW